MCNVREPLKSLDVSSLVQQSSREAHESHALHRIDPEDRAARAMTAESTRRGHGTELMLADDIAPQGEAEAEIRRERLPAARQSDALVELIRMLAGPVLGRHVQDTRADESPAVELAPQPQQFREAKHIGGC